jgi:mersacidin/lichenicidin family type 2 lantibiotic
LKNLSKEKLFQALRNPEMRASLIGMDQTAFDHPAGNMEMSDDDLARVYGAGLKTCIRETCTIRDED